MKRSALSNDEQDDPEEAAPKSGTDAPRCELCGAPDGEEHDYEQHRNYADALLRSMGAD